MAKENFNSWLEEKVEELRKTPQRNVVPIPNPRDAMRQFEDEIMADYLSFGIKVAKRIVHPFRDYNLEDGIKEEVGKIQQVLYDAVNDVYSHEKRIKAIEQKIDSLTVDRAYLINYRGQLEQLAAMLPKASVCVEQDNKLSDKQSEKESADGNSADEINKDNEDNKGKEMVRKITEEGVRKITAPTTKESSCNIGYIVAVSSLDEQAEYVMRETARVDALAGDYAKKIGEEQEKLRELTEEFRTYMHDAQENLVSSMIILHKIELFKEFAERYATKDTNPFIVERLNQLLAPYTKIMQDDELYVSHVSGVSEICLKLAGSFGVAKMLQRRNSGEINYMSDGVMDYFKEMTRIIAN